MTPELPAEPAAQTLPPLTPTALPASVSLGTLIDQAIAASVASAVDQRITAFEDRYLSLLPNAIASSVDQRHQPGRGQPARR